MAGVIEELNAAKKVSETMIAERQRITEELNAAKKVSETMIAERQRITDRKAFTPNVVQIHVSPF
jgi:hypothetical protein